MRMVDVEVRVVPVMMGQGRMFGGVICFFGYFVIGFIGCDESDSGIVVGGSEFFDLDRLDSVAVDIDSILEVVVVFWDILELTVYLHLRFVHDGQAMRNGRTEGTFIFRLSLSFGPWH